MCVRVPSQVVIIKTKLYHLIKEDTDGKWAEKKMLHVLCPYGPWYTWNIHQKSIFQELFVLFFVNFVVY